MKVVVYDPLYSNIGHFFRYNKFIIRLLDQSDAVKSIVVICEDKEMLSIQGLSNKVQVKFVESGLDSMQVKAMKAKGLQKVFLAREAYKNYKSIIRIINESECDIALFTSQGLLPFWICAKKLKVKYATSLISVRWIYNKYTSKFPLYYVFRSFIKRASLNIYIENFYRDLTSRHVESFNIVMPDRALSKIPCSIRIQNSQLRLITLGTISKIKSPIEILKQWGQCSANVLANFSYKIHGKVLDESLLSEIEELAKSAINVDFTNDYISQSAFDNTLGQSDFVVIPYSFEYTKSATSGVMWDCFEKQKPIICPDIEPFRYYVNKYQIGYLYKEGDLNGTLQKIVEEQDEFFSSLPKNYESLINANSEQAFIRLLENALLESKGN